MTLMATKAMTLFLGGVGADQISGGDGNDYYRWAGRGEFSGGDAGDDTLLGGPDTDDIAGGTASTASLPLPEPTLSAPGLVTTTSSAMQAMMSLLPAAGMI